MLFKKKNYNVLRDSPRPTLVDIQMNRIESDLVAAAIWTAVTGKDSVCPKVNSLSNLTPPKSSSGVLRGSLGRTSALL